MNPEPPDWLKEPKERRMNSINAEQQTQMSPETSSEPSQATTDLLNTRSKTWKWLSTQTSLFKTA